MGGVTYTIDNDSVKFNDNYGFDIYRVVNPQGKVITYKKSEDNGIHDKYNNSPWKGLISDLLNYSKLGYQNIAENFATRQGKTRDNSFGMSIKEVNDRNNK